MGKRLKMEYTPALLSGLPADEHSVVDMIAKYLLPLRSPGRQSSSARRGSVDSCDEKEHSTGEFFFFFFLT